MSMLRLVDCVSQESEPRHRRLPAGLEMQKRLLQEALRTPIAAQRLDCLSISSSVSRAPLLAAEKLPSDLTGSQLPPAFGHGPGPQLVHDHQSSPWIGCLPRRQMHQFCCSPAAEIASNRATLQFLCCQIYAPRAATSMAISRLLNAATIAA